MLLEHQDDTASTAWAWRALVRLRSTLNILLLLALAYILLLLALIRISTVPWFTLPNQSPKLQHVYLPSFLLVGRSIQASSMMDPGNMPVFSSSSTAGSLLTSNGFWNPTPVLPSNVYKLQASFNSSVTVNQIQFKGFSYTNPNYTLSWKKLFIRILP